MWLTGRWLRLTGNVPDWVVEWLPGNAASMVEWLVCSVSRCVVVLCVCPH